MGIEFSNQAVNLSNATSPQLDLNPTVTLALSLEGDVKNTGLMAKAIDSWFSASIREDITLNGAIDDSSLYIYNAEGREILELDYQLPDQSSDDLIIYQMISEHPDFSGKGLMRYMQCQLIHLSEVEHVKYWSVTTGIPFVESMQNQGFYDAVDIYYENIHPGSITARARVNTSRVQQFCAETKLGT